MQPQYNTQYIPGGPTGLSQGLGALAGGLGQRFGQEGLDLGQSDLGKLLGKLLGGR